MNRKIIKQRHLSVLRDATRDLLKYKGSRYCHWLWDSVFITEDGKVFSCSRREPGIIGDIYRESLQSIWENSSKLKIYRTMYKLKCLPCYYHCNMILGKEKEKRNTIGKYPKRVWIRCGLRCNLNCVMCQQTHKSDTFINFHFVKQNIDWSQVEDIRLTGGEVLAMENAKAIYLMLTREKRKKVDIVTNGTLINKEWAGHLVRGSKQIQISVNSATKKTHLLVNRGSNFDKVIHNIETMIAFKKMTQSVVRIQFKYTICAKNIHEIIEAIELAEILGCDEIGFGYDRATVPFILNKATELRNRIKEGLESLIERDLDVRIERRTLNLLGLLEC